MRYSLFKNYSELRKLLGIIVALVACCNLSAQQISGVVTDANDGFGLPGVSVLVPGTTVGTITDVDGNYTLDVEGGKELQFSYIGYATVTVAINGKTKIDVQLSEDTQNIEEVVVTALGIKREKKALGYSMQELKGESLTQTRDANVANALAGKVAGLQI